MFSDISLVIVGAGLQGITLYINLPKKIQNRTLIIDKNTEALCNFYRQAHNVGMKYLRSPVSHCLKEPLVSLLAYSHAHNIHPQHFNGKYLTPSLALLEQYIHHLLRKTSIATQFFQTTLKNITYTNNKTWILDTSNGTISTKNCILALGMGTVSLPDTIQIKSEHFAYTKDTLQSMLIKKHVLHPQYTPSLKNTHSHRIAVIGGGMSGTQTALRYTDKEKTHRNSVSLISGKHASVHFFDSDPGYIGPKYRNIFLQETDYRIRRNIIAKARNVGSINPYVHEKLVNAIKQKQIEHIKEYARSIRIKNNGDTHTYTVQLSNNDEQEYDDIIFATGFAKNEVPHKSLVQNIATQYGCKTDNNMWPIPDKNLLWHHGLYLMGALAELELGPAARNIIGAHLACRNFKHSWEQWV